MSWRRDGRCRQPRETRRRYNGRRSPVKSAPMTPELALAVASYAQAYPDKPLGEIGAVFRINSGRVSEVLGGKRT